MEYTSVKCQHQQGPSTITLPSHNLVSVLTCVVIILGTCYIAGHHDHPSKLVHFIILQLETCTAQSTQPRAPYYDRTPAVN